MEGNVCDINHLDGDVLLPPRKRLLAGLKKQSLDGPSRLLSLAATSSELDTRLNNKLSSHLNNPSLSPEEIAEASRSAASAAAKVAKAARAAAEVKAAIAAKALAAAKSALELVASVSEETTCKGRHSKKNKLKKHVPVQLLYKKHQSFGNVNTDEELARKLHRAMNSSPRITKNTSTSDWKNNKHKKPKLLPSVEKATLSNGGIVVEGSSHSMCNGNDVSGEVNSEGSSREVYTIKLEGKASKFCKANQLEMSSGEAGPSHSRDKSRETIDETSPSGRKRGRIRLKKLPLSNCTFRDQASPNELKSGSSAVREEIRGKSTDSDVSMFPVDLSAGKVMSIEAASTWKCQDIKAPQCVKQNKVMQS